MGQCLTQIRVIIPPIRRIGWTITLCQLLQFCGFLYKLLPMTSAGVFDMLTVKEFTKHIGFIVVHTNICALGILDLTRARIMVCCEIREYITLKQNRFSGTSFIVAKHKPPLDGLNKMVCLNGAVVNRC